MTYSRDEITDALYEATAESGLDLWLTMLIENKIAALGVHEDSDPEFIDKLSDEMWPEAMTAVLQYLMEEQSGDDKWDVNYHVAEGTQYFTIVSRFRMGEPIL